MGDSLIDKYPHLKSLLQEEPEPEEPEPSRVKSGRSSLLGPGGPVTSKSSVRSAGPRTAERTKLPPFKAEELFARSMGADRDHWLGFQVRIRLYIMLLFFPKTLILIEY